MKFINRLRSIVREESGQDLLEYALLVALIALVLAFPFAWILAEWLPRRLQPLALLLVAPFVVSEYWLAQVTFILIYAVVGLGLMLLSGFTGQFSIGHAAFLGMGAYTHAILNNLGVPSRWR